MFIKSEEEIAKDYFSNWLLVKSYISFDKQKEIVSEPLIAFVSHRSLDDKAGELLRGAIEKGLKLKMSDVFLCSTAGEIPEDLKQLKPKVIVTLGGMAYKDLTGIEQEVIEARGQWSFWEGVKLMPTFELEEILLNPDLKKDFWGDLKLVMEELNL